MSVYRGSIRVAVYHLRLKITPCWSQARLMTVYNPFLLFINEYSLTHLNILHPYLNFIFISTLIPQNITH